MLKKRPPCVSCVFVSLLRKGLDSVRSGPFCQGCLYSKKPWNADRISLWERTDLFSDQDNKDNVSLQDKDWTGLLATSSEDWGFLSSVSLSCDANPQSVLHPPLLPPWAVEDKGDQCGHKAPAACCSRSNRVRCFGARSFVASASIYENAAD